MARPKINIPAGTRFDSLTATGRSEFITVRGYRYSCHECLCVCGSLRLYKWGSLRRGVHRSCGCLPHGNSTHGYTRLACGRKIPEYRTWDSIKQRCYNPKCRSYKSYGGRGIKVCKRWVHSFLTFLTDVGPRPSLAHSLDRWPDNNGNYEPGNVRWAKPKEQSRNRRSNRYLTVGSETRCVSEWADICGIKAATLLARIDSGMPPLAVVTTPLRQWPHKATASE